MSVLPEFREVMASPLRHDLTELPGLDYLSSPTGAIKEAQELAAAAFGADATWFLVNGTTVGIQAAVLATCGPADALILARNCHLAAFSAMALAGCHPIYVMPVQDENLGIAHGITPDALRRAFSNASSDGRHVGAVLVVCPTYFGITSDIAQLASICHEHGAPLLVDEAHGGHFAFHASFPAHALAQGADVTIQSTHKVLSSLGQSSMLHVKGDRVSHECISRALQTLQSSSPSYLLLASLDAARAHAQLPDTFQEPLDAAAAARQLLRELPGSGLLDDHIQTGTDGIHGVDPLRLTLVANSLGMSGFALDDLLQREFGVCAEMSTDKTVVFALGPGSRMEHVRQLAAALSSIRGRSRSPSQQRSQPPLQSAAARSSLPEMRLTPREAFFARTARVSAHEAVGRICAELLCPYPPGVPAVVPGELLTTDVIEMLRQVASGGGKVAGAADSSLETFAVILEAS
ncbi:PLP-dependent transferase [Coccomyxa subellipsoidea C-169]|uniref:PLP-dependent transferase n=1 Tax=Coccomyxa subellipsoidea (strain C-169) TaxID=574566 RepID=I0YPY6_COCSC|nr:PLP-dependent transferase [Coccomyxa subellipsoidea C-169]EIE20455.1 PLP-dependent transferase [Coccomyxa subellipsoidea C-169]|eukprot:XP_005644999.1 PLP-dependent transferase [Coccomyxa subellipsoidea C-169]